MALSNWDTMAFDHEGKSSNGVFTSPSGVSVGFYKNWLYVRDPKGWTPGSYTEPTVMQIESGVVQYKDVHISAFRGPQSGVYATVFSYAEDYKSVTGMIGCGVYGYDGGGEEGWVGVEEESIRWFQQEMIAGEMEPLSEDFKYWIFKHENDIPDVLRWALLVGKPLRFNQGDAYFAHHLGGETSATAPGEAEAPILSQMLSPHE